MKLEIQKTQYEVVDSKEKITVADSFVVRQNKIGTGNGEAKLYVGNEGPELRDFFGKKGFGIKCFLLKKDLIKYLDETRDEYLNPEQPYLNKEKLPQLLTKRINNISTLPEKLEFEICEQTQIAGPRVYVKSSDRGYKLLRELSLPNITYISIVKLKSGADIEYYFRLFADYFGDLVHPHKVKIQFEEIIEVKDDVEREVLRKSRIGQGKYREELLKLCPFCPITLVSDERILIASHIKPWSQSSPAEKIDPYNGFMFTPTIDHLFDRGFISFTNDQRTILSPFLSKMTYSKIGISDNKIVKHLPLEGREDYLEYHRNEILKGR